MCLSRCRCRCLCLCLFLCLSICMEGVHAASIILYHIHFPPLAECIVPVARALPLSLSLSLCAWYHILCSRGNNVLCRLIAMTKCCSSSRPRSRSLTSSPNTGGRSWFDWSSRIAEVGTRQQLDEQAGLVLFDPVSSAVPADSNGLELSVDAGQR